MAASSSREDIRYPDFCQVVQPALTPLLVGLRRSFVSELYQFQRSERYTTEGTAFVAEHGLERLQLTPVLYRSSQIGVQPHSPGLLSRNPKCRFRERRKQPLFSPDDTFFVARRVPRGGFARAGDEAKQLHLMRR